MLIKLFIELIIKGVLFIREGFKVNVNIFLLSAISGHPGPPQGVGQAPDNMV